MKCCDLYAGKLKRDIAITQKTRTPDGMGGFTYTEATVASVRAYIKPRSGSERLYADKLNASNLSSAFIRYRNDINESMTVVYRGEKYQIRSIINIEEQDKWLELVIERNVAT